MEKDIYILHETLENYISKNIFSTFLIRKFSFQFARLLSFMEKNSISMYSKEVGQKYLNFKSLPGNNRRRSASAYNYDARYITLLNGMLDDEWIEKMSKKDYDIPFPGNFGEYVMDFLQKYTEERRLHVKTRNNYYCSLYKFCERMQFDNVTSLSDITSGRVLDFVSSVQNCKDHVAIILRAFLKHLYNEGIVDWRTATILEKIKTRPVEKLPSYYTPMEIMGIEESIDRKSPMGKRNYAMLLLATRLGLRSSDIRHLQFSNLDWDKNLIYLQQYKTGKQIELPLLADVGEAIIDYVQHGRPKSALKQIFLRATSPYEPLTNTWCAFNKYFSRSKLSLAKRRRGGHAMRHSLATNMLKKGTPITVICDSLGHAGSATTMKYIHLNISGLLKCALEVPPVDENFICIREKEFMSDYFVYKSKFAPYIEGLLKEKEQKGKLNGTMFKCFMLEFDRFFQEYHIEDLHIKKDTISTWRATRLNDNERNFQ